MKKVFIVRKVFMLLLLVSLVFGTTVQALANGLPATGKTGTDSAVTSKSSVTEKMTSAAVAAKSVKLNKTSATLTKGKTLTLTATISPGNATNKTLKWKSSNTKVAKVDSKGKVTAVGAGSAKITVTTSNGKTATAAITVPYSKSLSAGTWKAGTHLPAGRYKITTTSYSGNLFIAVDSYDRYINEILASNAKNGVTAVTTDIKKGDEIQIMGLDKVLFTQVAHKKSNTLHAGYWTVGKDISAGRYKVTTTDRMGNFIVTRAQSLIANEILSAKRSDYSVTSVTTTLKDGDRIQISGLNKVSFAKK
ncbi:Ig-like protein group 2 [Planomicrobium soli]|uniref:Ig-like protein group 2 n=1 Tax=Planomicrobium soli TaxID=1176648 RepID=A0A2P8H3C2_9BACL|nr:Ig-like domain-containing protein [Planomicrobium soli]PSL40716.1 Ig-like protein group 2 [Planomicrobium soli]